MISFVSPIYQAENTARNLVAEIHLLMKRINESYEIILIDDRSTDNSWKLLKELSFENKEVTSIRLSKNFGQHPAIMAGLKNTSGDWIIVLDCDLQDQPKEIFKLYSKALKGYDAVLAKRKSRKDSKFKKFMSYSFAKVFGYFTDTNYDHEIGNFGIYKRKVVDSILNIPDQVLFFPLFVKYVGYNTTSIEVEHNFRLNGESNYNLTKLLKLAFNIIVSFSNKPLKLMVKFGVLISIISFFFGTYYLYKALTNQIFVLGYSSIIISIWFLSGIIITIIGICGIYLGKIFDQAKGREVYIIDEKL